METYKYMVQVNCMTYNHAPYIVDAMNGFCMQKTTFPYVCTIIDDTSTDGEPEIIKQYLLNHFSLDNKALVKTEETEDYYLTFAQHKTNKNCFFAVLFLKYNHYNINKSKINYIKEWNDNAKYIALCEGDDYWIDPLKLQKQVDFMESHPGHSLCFHAHTNVLTNKKNIVYRYDNSKEIVLAEDIILGDGGFMATASMLYRPNMIKDIPEWRKKAPIGDYPLTLQLSSVGMVGYLHDNMSCYRVSANGSWSQKIAKDEKMYKKWYKGCIEMLDGFNEWSSGRFIKQVRIMKKKLRVARLKRFIHKLIELNFIISY